MAEDPRHRWIAPSIARSLANLERRGFIEKQYRRIQVLDGPGLKALVSA